MKKFISTAAFLMTMGLAIQAEAIPTFYFDFNGDSLADSMIATSVGDSFTADVFIGSIDNYYEGIFGASVNVLYDQALAGVSSGPQYDPSWDFDVTNMSPGVVSMNAALLAGTLFDDPLHLGSVTFTTTAAGNFDLVLADPGATIDSLGAILADGSAHIYDPDIIYQSANVNVSAVPLPGAVFLLGSGLAGILGLRRKLGRG